MKRVVNGVRGRLSGGTHRIARLALGFAALAVLALAPLGAQTNVAQGKAISASSYTQVYTAANANDGNVSTYWEGAPNSYPATLTVDLGADTAITAVELLLNPAWGTRSQTFAILGKTAAAASYTTLKASAAYTFTGGTNLVNVPVTSTARYVQLSFTANTQATSGQVAEFRVYGSQSVSQGPYGGSARAIANGAVIQAEDYDTGGEGVAYHDVDSGNSGGAYRSENVDIEGCSDSGGGYNVGWMRNGEWLEYTVNSAAGVYDITLRAASGVSGSPQVRLLLDGAALGTATLAGTGGWQSFQDFTIQNVTVPAKTNGILRLEVIGNDCNVNYVKFALDAPVTTYVLTVNSGSGDGSYAAGTAVTITADAPASGKVFDKWTGGADASFASRASSTTTYTTTAGAVTVSATYKDAPVTNYTLTVNSGSGDGSYSAGTAVTIVADAPASGYVFSSWTGGTAGAFANAASATTTYTVQSANQTITANYAPVQTGTNLAVGKAIEANSTVFTFVAANANDNSVATYWEGAGGSYPNTLTVKLGANADITGVTVKLNPDSAWGARNQTIEVLGREQSASSFTSLKAASSYAFNPASGNSVTIPVSARVADVQLKFTANSGSSAGQCAEFQVTGTMAPNPDLVVTGMSVSPANPTEADSVSVSATVKNQGSAASAASTVSLYVGGVKKGTANVAALASGSSATVSLAIGSLDAGSYSLAATADEGNAVVETNDGNNSFTSGTSLVVTQVQSSDLVPTASWTPSNPSAGNTVTFTAVISNQGIMASASGSHAVSATLKNASGATVKSFSASYSGTIAAGASATVTLGTWTAVDGSYTLDLSVAADANEVTAKQANNAVSAGFYSGRGANMPYTRIEAESAAVATNGTRLAPNFKLADYAGEASGRSAVLLDAQGEYAEFTLTQAANGFVLRSAVDDGVSGTISVYANGASVADFQVTSKFSHVYATPSTLGRLGYDNSGTTAYWLYEEAQLLLPTVYPVGTKIRIQKDSGDVAKIHLDFLEFENVAPAAANPDPSKYVQVSASKSIDAALNEFRQDSSKKGIFIPAGNWTLDSKIYLYGRATEIIGAGPWHTKLIAPADRSNTDVGFNVSSQANGSTIKNLSAWGNYQYRTDGPGKFIDGNGMQNVTVDNVWVEHFVCMYWGVGSSYNTFSNCRIRNTFADGINMTNGSSYNNITNCEARGNGDDAFALFSAADAGGSYNTGNRYTNLTAILTRRAAAFAVYGGSGNLFQNLYAADTLTYPGLTINSYSFGYNTLGFGDQDCVFDGITLDRTGGDFWTSVGADDKINDYQNFGAIWFYAGDRAFKNIVVKNVTINDPVYFGLMFQCMYPNPQTMSNVRIENVTVNRAARYGLKLVVSAEQGQGAPVGSASFTNVQLNNSGVSATYGIDKSPLFTVVKGSGNNW